VTLFAFYGTFTSSQPGHGNLAGARLVEWTRTAPRYRLLIVDGLWPALVPAVSDPLVLPPQRLDRSSQTDARAEPAHPEAGTASGAGGGAAIECELYECSEELLERLARIEPPGWNRAPLELEDGRRVEAFVGDAGLAARGTDVSEHGSWAAFVSSRARLRARGPTPP
jgi:Gamma-glutamyl cyclotransferase, AIG2-like